MCDSISVIEFVDEMKLHLYINHKYINVVFKMHLNEILLHLQSVSLHVVDCSKPAGGGRALKLGSKSKDVEQFVDQLRSEGESK